eukprot:gene12565-8611_t
MYCYCISYSSSVSLRHGSPPILFSSSSSILLLIRILMYVYANAQRETKSFSPTTPPLFFLYNTQPSRVPSSFSSGSFVFPSFFSSPSVVRTRATHRTVSPPTESETCFLCTAASASSSPSVTTCDEGTHTPFLECVRQRRIPPLPHFTSVAERSCAGSLSSSFHRRFGVFSIAPFPFLFLVEKTPQSNNLNNFGEREGVVVLIIIIIILFFFKFFLSMEPGVVAEESGNVFLRCLPALTTRLIHLLLLAVEGNMDGVCNENPYANEGGVAAYDVLGNFTLTFPHIVLYSEAAMREEEREKMRITSLEQLLDTRQLELAFFEHFYLKAWEQGGGQTAALLAGSVDSLGCSANSSSSLCREVPARAGGASRHHSPHSTHSSSSRRLQQQQQRIHEHQQVRDYADAELRCLMPYFFVDAQRCAFEALQVTDGDVTCGLPAEARQAEALGLPLDGHSEQQPGRVESEGRHHALLSEAAAALQFLMSVAFSCPSACMSAAAQLVLADVNAKRLQLEWQAARCRCRPVPNFFRDNRHQLAVLRSWSFPVEDALRESVVQLLTTRLQRYKHLTKSRPPLTSMEVLDDLPMQQQPLPPGGLNSRHPSSKEATQQEPKDPVLSRDDAQRVEAFLQMDASEQRRRIRYAGEVLKLRWSARDGGRAMMLTPWDTLLWVTGNGSIVYERVRDTLQPSSTSSRSKRHSSPSINWAPRIHPRSISQSTCYSAPRRHSAALPILQYMLLQNEMQAAQIMAQLVCTALVPLCTGENLRPQPQPLDSTSSRSGARNATFAGETLRHRLALLRGLAQCHMLCIPRTHLTRKQVLSSVFSEWGECPSYYGLLASASASYLAAHHATLRYLLFEPGPLGTEVRLMVMMMAASRHRCVYLVRRCATLFWLYLARVENVAAAGEMDGDSPWSDDEEEEEEAEAEPTAAAPPASAPASRGSPAADEEDYDTYDDSSEADPTRHQSRQQQQRLRAKPRRSWRERRERWLTHGPPARLRAVQRWIALAAHQPWRLCEEEVRRCREASGLSLPQLFQVSILIAHTLALSSFVMGMFVPSEPWTATVLPRALYQRLEESVAHPPPPPPAAATAAAQQGSDHRSLEALTPGAAKPNQRSHRPATPGSPTARHPHAVATASASNRCSPPASPAVASVEKSEPSSRPPGPRPRPRDIFHLYGGDGGEAAVAAERMKGSAALWSADFEWHSGTGIALLQQFYPGIAPLLLVENEAWGEAVGQLRHADVAGLAPPTVPAPDFALNSLHGYVLSILGYSTSDFPSEHINRVVLRRAKAFAQQMVIRPEQLEESTLFGPGAPTETTTAAAATASRGKLLNDLILYMMGHMAREAEMEEAAAAGPGGEADGGGVAVETGGPEALLHWVCQQAGCHPPDAALMVAQRSATSLWGDDAMHCAMSLQNEKLLLHIAVAAMTARRDAVLHWSLYALSEYVHHQYLTKLLMSTTRIRTTANIFLSVRICVFFLSCVMMIRVMFCALFLSRVSNNNNNNNNKKKTKQNEPLDWCPRNEMNGPIPLHYRRQMILWLLTHEVARHIIEGNRTFTAVLLVSVRCLVLSPLARLLQLRSSQPKLLLCDNHIILFQSEGDSSRITPSALSPISFFFFFTLVVLCCFHPPFILSKKQKKRIGKRQTTTSLFPSGVYLQGAAVFTMDNIDDFNNEDFIYNEYVIDDTLDPINRLAKYYNSDFSLQRLGLVKELFSTCESAGYSESVKVIVPLLTHFTSDVEPAVRQALVEQLPDLARYFVENGGEEGYDHLLKTFLPMGFELLVDKNVEVETFALTTISSMAELVHTEDVEVHLLSVVVTLAHDERAEDYRVAAAQLFNQLAFTFGKEFCVHQVIPELELLSNDSSFSVRKTVAKYLGGVAKAVAGDRVQDNVLTLYLNLCRDDVWGVRQACVEASEEVSLAVNDSARVAKLVPIYKVFLEDPSRWVRNRAFEFLGRFIHTLRSEDITPELLKNFTDMAFQAEIGDPELSEYCAFFLPAVVQAIGRERWSAVRDSYATLVKDVQWKVRKSLAYSLHELALLLGTELTEEYLVPAFDVLLRDLDDVKLGVVLNVDKFLQMVSMPTRESLVPALCRVPFDSENWRLRNEVAKRIGDVGVLLTPGSHGFSSVVALVLRLLDDSVMAVRESTYKPAAMILKHLADSKQSELANYLNTIVGLSSRPSFHGRQMYAYVVQCTAQVGADYLLQTSLLEGMVHLSQDPVPNVRLVVEKIMANTFLKSSKWKDQPKVVQCMKNIRKMKDENALPTPAAPAANITNDEEN